MQLYLGLDYSYCELPASIIKKKLPIAEISGADRSCIELKAFHQNKVLHRITCVLISTVRSPTLATKLFVCTTITFVAGLDVNQLVTYNSNIATVV